MFLSFSCQGLVDRLSLPKSSVHEIRIRDLSLRNLFAVWVPHNFTISQKSTNLNSSGILSCSSSYFSSSQFLSSSLSWVRIKRSLKTGTKIFVKYENWLLWEKVYCILQIQEYSPKRLWVKLMQQGNTVDCKTVVDFLSDTMKRFGSSRSGMIPFTDLFLICDNAKHHRSSKNEFL